MSAAQLDDKDSFLDLTPKQKAVVRAYAEMPDAGHKAISERASELMEGDETVSRSYVQPILETYRDIAERQLAKTQNERFEGEERTTGDPFENLAQTLGDDSKPHQTIQERPVQDTDERQETISADLTRHDIEALLAGEVPKELQRELVVELVARAFERADH